MTTTLETLCTGMLAATFFVAALFFLKFWRESRDLFFLAFAAFFVIKGANTVTIAFMARPNEGTLGSHLVSLFSSLLILAAIGYKNLKGR